MSLTTSIHIITKSSDISIDFFNVTPSQINQKKFYTSGPVYFFSVKVLLLMIVGNENL